MKNKKEKKNVVNLIYFVIYKNVYIIKKVTLKQGQDKFHTQKYIKMFTIIYSKSGFKL